ncbi:inositol monophosphatase family protein [Aciduricibacillus chroicocephali]|uniref:inositol-phosphate phosphatase n=1 Tax=Aciduricibacillus chroicocephali TaxID=3054939 RepID=A0ABY9KYD3_9BACI|nr:inositol monophosphatase family protein [Bacillaceae bacterium 44XB]
MKAEIRNSLYEQAKEWILEAGARIRKQMRDPLVISIKSNPQDLVTTVDEETERFLAGKIRELYPDHHLISEEGFGDNLNSMKGTVWLIDPIDGTTNFIHQRRNFAISAGIYHDGIGEIGLIYDVMGDCLYSAKKGEGAFKNEERLPQLREGAMLERSVLAMNNKWLIPNPVVQVEKMEELIRTVRATRTYGSAALEFAYVAEGIVDGYMTIQLSPWDIAAGIIIVNEVGGVTTNVFGEHVDILKKNSILVCNKKIHGRIVNDFILEGKK